MASLVILMQLRYLFYEFQRRIKRHKNYLRVVKNMEARYIQNLDSLNPFCASGDFGLLLITFANNLDPDQDGQNVGPNLDSNGLTL